MSCGSSAFWRRVAVAGLLLIASALGHAEPWARHTVDDSAVGADGVRLADVNGDGRADIATAWEEAGEIRVYLHPGKDGLARPWPRVTVGRAATPEDAVFADLDRDGAVDVVSSCEGGERSIYLHWAPVARDRYLDAEAWETVALAASVNRMQWMYCLPFDMDADGDLDLVAGAKGADAAVGWFRCPEDARDSAAWTWHPLVPAGWIMSIAAADVNGEGREDLVISDRRGPARGVYWLAHPEDSADTWVQHRVGPVDTEEVMFLSVAPPAADGGGPRIFCGVTPQLLVGYTARDAAAGTWERSVWSIPAGYGTAKGVALLKDETGSEALLFSCEHAEDKRGAGGIALGPGAGFDVAGEGGTKFDQLVRYDVDGDGDEDLLTTEERERLGVIWYENPGPGKVPGSD